MASAPSYLLGSTTQEGFILPSTSAQAFSLSKTVSGETFILTDAIFGATAPTWELFNTNWDLASTVWENLA